MTPAVRNGAGSAADLLFGPGTRAAEELAGHILSEVNLDVALPELRPPTREAAVREAAAQAAGLLDVDLIGVVLTGWRLHHELAGAARRTLAAPGSTELVDLTTHQITSIQEPSVAVLVDRREVATLRLSLSLEFEISAVVAGIREGLLVAIHSGHCDATGTLAIQGTEVLTRRAHFELPGLMAVSPGIRLLPADDYPAGGYPVQGGADGEWRQSERTS
jgi:hypothetical protein